MIADVVFDLPLDRPFSYSVPPILASRITVGQRVRAPLQRRPRVGFVVALREEVDASLEQLLELVDPVGLLPPALVGLARHVASQTLSSWGSACAAFLPPPKPLRGALKAPPVSGGHPPLQRPMPPTLLIGGDREEELLALLRSEARERGLLLIAPEIEEAEAWAGRLDAALGLPPLRLHSGRPEGERYASWIQLALGNARVAVATRAGLLAPMPTSAWLALVDEHDPAHKSPATPRFHARDVAEWRAGAEGHRLILTSATPSVESWWRAEDSQFQLVEGRPATWPEVNVVDLRGSDPVEPISRPLREGIGQALARGGQGLLLVMRLGYAPALTCAECGFSPRCSDCRISLTFSRQSRELRCHLCRRQERAPALCPRCRGRTLTARGWGTERIEEAARAAFPGVPVVRYDGESARGGEGRTLRRLIARGEARLVVGTRSALKLFPRGALGAVGVITPDSLLHLPDFRAAERTFQLLWEAAERTGMRAGQLIVQTHHPEHYALAAITHQDRATFYRNELKFRAELAYPPFSRLVRIVIRGGEGTARDLAERIRQELAPPGAAAPTVYGPTALRPAARWQLMVKGDRELPARLLTLLRPLPMRRGSTAEVDVDPTDLPR
jgi:primosomal protein N' (replication factor Y)